MILPVRLNRAPFALSRPTQMQDAFGEVSEVVAENFAPQPPNVARLPPWRERESLRYARPSAAVYFDYSMKDDEIPPRHATAHGVDRRLPLISPLAFPSTPYNQGLGSSVFCLAMGCGALLHRRCHQAHSCRAPLTSGSAPLVLSTGCREFWIPNPPHQRPRSSDFPYPIRQMGHLRLRKHLLCLCADQGACVERGERRYPAGKRFVPCGRVQSGAGIEHVYQTHSPALL